MRLGTLVPPEAQRGQTTGPDPTSEESPGAPSPAGVLGPRVVPTGAGLEGLGGEDREASEDTQRRMTGSGKLGRSG